MMGDVAELIVVTGPPGAGKTVVSRALSSMFDPSALVAGDAFFAFVDRGYLPPWTSEAHRQNEIVVDAAAAAAGRLARGGYTVTYDGVIGPWLIDTFVVAAGLGAVHYVVLLPSEPTCVERVRSRVGHGFTDLDATRHMYGEFAGAAVDSRHLIEDADGADVIASRIFRLVQDGAARWPARGH
jgi:hypothetical protein